MTDNSEVVTYEIRRWANAAYWELWKITVTGSWAKLSAHPSELQAKIAMHQDMPPDYDRIDRYMASGKLDCGER